MTTINQRVDQIKNKRKQTPFRDFLKEIVSWQPIVFYKTDGIVSRFPKTERIKSVVKYSDFDKVNEDIFDRGQEYDFNKAHPTIRKWGLPGNPGCTGVQLLLPGRWSIQRLQFID